MRCGVTRSTLMREVATEGSLVTDGQLVVGAVVTSAVGRYAAQQYGAGN